MKYSYPTFIVESDGSFLVYVPDMGVYTEGDSLTDAIEMARDAIGLRGIGLEDRGRKIPNPSNEVRAYEKGNTDDFDYTQGGLTMVDIDFVEYRRMKNNQTDQNVASSN